MAELALDDHERHTFASHFDGVGVPQLMWSEPSAEPGAAETPVAA